MTQNEIVRYELAYQLKQHCKMTGETQKELAKRMNLPFTVVKHTEEERPLPAIEFCKMCAGIGVSIDALKTGPRDDAVFHRLVRACIDFCGSEDGLASDEKAGCFRASLCEMIPKGQRTRYSKWLEYLVGREPD